MNKIGAVPLKGINYGCNKRNNNIYTRRKKRNTRKMNSTHTVKNNIY